MPEPMKTFLTPGISRDWQELHQPGMVFVQRGAVCRAEPVRAGALLPARAGEGIHVGSRPAHVLDDALEARHLREPRRLAQDGAFAAALHNPALVVGEGAKGAGAKAAPVAGDGEAHRLQGRDGFPVRGMGQAGERKLVDHPALRWSGAGQAGSG